ncbi:MAG: hypothetical protein QMD04_04345 [Anaerolineales bacterium]|nr:hypothetical protein [Anaerolineales bacterium]
MNTPLLLSGPKKVIRDAGGGSETNGKIDVRHLDIWGKATLVHFPARRFDCGRYKVLQEAIYEDLSWIESKHRESTAYELQIFLLSDPTPRSNASATSDILHII